MTERKHFTEWAMDIAEQTKTRSTCLSRQIGCVIIKERQIIASGYNGAPSGAIHCTDIGYCERRKRNIPSGQELEICRAGHAEANAINQCAKHGTSCKDAVMYATTQPCVFCCISIIQAGIRKIVFKGEYPTGLGLQLLNEAGIEYIEYEKELEKEKALFNFKREEELQRARIFSEQKKNY